jgi:hypothetical protein
VVAVDAQLGAVGEVAAELDEERAVMPISALRPVCRPPGYAVFAVKVLVKWLFLRSVVGIILAL